MTRGQREARNTRLRTLYARGVRKSELARLSGLTFMQIHRILGQGERGKRQHRQGRTPPGAGRGQRG